MEESGNKLMLAGVSKQVTEQLERTGVLEIIGEENVFPEHRALGAAFLAAISAANTWIEAGGEPVDQTTDVGSESSENGESA